MYKKLRLRLTLACTAATCLILALLTAAALRLSEHQLGQRARETFDTAAASVQNVLAGGGPVDYTWLARTEAEGGLLVHVESMGAPFLYTSLHTDNSARTALFEQAKKTALEDYGFDLLVPPPNQLTEENLSFEIKGRDGMRYYAKTAKIPVRDNWIGFCALKSQKEDRRLVSNLRRRFALLVGLAGGFLFLFSYFFTARTLKPVEENQKRQAAFVWAASHELRSPLAVMRTGVEAARRAPEQASRFLSVIDGECSRMARLVEDMLVLARADSQTWSIRPEDTQMELLLLTVAESFEAAAARNGIALRVSLPDNVLLRCRCDPQRIEQVLLILLDNAACYTPAGGTISLSAARRHGGIQFCVADNGPGIPDAYKERVFERFFQADPARSKKEHYGLGLSIAAEIVALHGGTIRVGDTPGGGSTFTVFIPSKGKPPHA